MTGEKLALTAVALAVVLLQFSTDPVSVIVFENEAHKLVRSEDVSKVLEQFIDVPAQGYTHLEAGLILALKETRNLASDGRSRPIATLLLTDGKYTAGRDPTYLASKFSNLVVLKMGEDRASFQLISELACLGHGSLREVKKMEDLPMLLYTVVKDLLRGKS